MLRNPSRLRSLIHVLRPIDTVDAHCDLMCGVYNPAQARIEAESVHMTAVKYHESDDETFRQRCVSIKEERAELVKHHLSVLWTDYFKPNHLEEYPDLHEKFWLAIKAAGDAKKTMDPKAGEELLSQIDAISDIFWATKGGKDRKSVV
jgi:nickel superoxide dismutase